MRPVEVGLSRNSRAFMVFSLLLFGACRSKNAISRAARAGSAGAATASAQVRSLTLLTPGIRQRLATDRALGFLSAQNVATLGLTYAQALLKGSTWEVVLVEAPEKPGFAGYKYSVTLSEPALEVEGWQILSQQ